MALLFARKSIGGNWDAITDETPEDSSFPVDVLADVLGGANEVSVWEIAQASSPEQLDAQPLGPALDILAAALHSEHANDLSDIAFRVISDWKINDLALRMKKERGTSVDARLNKEAKHWIIQITSVGEAIKLAKAFKKRDAHFYSKEQVLRLFAVSVQQGRISTERITSGLWKKLLDGGFLRVVAQQQEQDIGGDRSEAQAHSLGAEQNATPSTLTPQADAIQAQGLQRGKY